MPVIIYSVCYIDPTLNINSHSIKNAETAGIYVRVVYTLLLIKMRVGKYQFVLRCRVKDVYVEK